MSEPRHVMILASAGSGKTYALTNRFVALLARGARPERIVALTFTRKAAGEFFDEILNKLARAAREPAFAEKLAREIEQPQFGTTDFIRMLRSVIDAMHRLRLGTLDGFFARIARTFPLELGLAGEFEVLQEHAARIERQRVLRRMFARAGELATAQKEFIEAFKRATFGAEEKRLGPRLDAFLDDHQEKFLSAPRAENWGQADRIWPRGTEWLGDIPPRGKAAQALREALAAAELNEKQRARWEAFFMELPGWMPGAELPKPVAYLLGNALEAWPELAEIVVERKKFTPTPAMREALRALLRSIVGAVLARQLEMTRGIHAVLRGYEAVYHDAVRRAGKLTFGDVQRLLAPEVSGQTLTRSPDSEESGRLFIDFRLDAEIEHWLLDEFQDTSFGQWSVLRNLIDEAIQDPEGVRSFFCVGDVKQAIFTWREGDPRLFREIFEHYNAARRGAIAERHLVDSWRSGPALIEMVNSVFGDARALEEVVPGAASAAWNREWRAHASAVQDRNGHAALLHAEDESGRWALALKLLLEIRPLERGLTCAVLVPTNATATEFADYLRREGGIPAVAESDLHVCTDNPLGAVLLALVQVAAHPGDSLAWMHVGMTPLRAVLAAEDLLSPEAVAEGILRQIHAGGFERTLEHWLRRLEPRGGWDDFNRERAQQLTAAAGLFDQTGSRDVAEFVQFMQRHTVRDAESAAVVRVMTIHKAKGLGFDVVLLPDLEGKRLDERRAGLAVQKAADRTVEWVFDLPPKIFWEHDEVLAGHVRGAEAEAGYEALSLLYVAMTRAKRAMYVITQPVGKSVSRNFPKLLAETLGGDPQPLRVGKLAVAGPWSRGDADWHLQVVAAEKSPGVGTRIEVISEQGAKRVARRSVRRPSGEKGGSFPAAQVFSLEATAGADFGTVVHELLAEIEWCTPAESEKYVVAWRDRAVDEAAREEALSCLRERDLAPMWVRPTAPRVEVWRERAFEVVLEGSVWVTGVFDRVVVERDEAGRALRATVSDFKTDRLGEEVGLADAAARHAGQLNLYRKVVAVLASIPVENVKCELVFTRRRERVVVPDDR